MGRIRRAGSVTEKTRVEEACELGVGHDPQLRTDIPQMVIHGEYGSSGSAGYLLVTHSARNQLCDLPFRFRQ